jgi:hypothetical protein
VDTLHLYRNNLDLELGSVQNVVNEFQFLDQSLFQDNLLVRVQKEVKKPEIRLQTRFIAKLQRNLLLILV